jgi:hypothetical protein
MRMPGMIEREQSLGETGVLAEFSQVVTVTEGHFSATQFAALCQAARYHGEAGYAAAKSRQKPG